MHQPTKRLTSEGKFDPKSSKQTYTSKSGAAHPRYERMDC